MPERRERPKRGRACGELVARLGQRESISSFCLNWARWAVFCSRQMIIRVILVLQSWACSWLLWEGGIACGTPGGSGAIGSIRRSKHTYPKSITATTRQSSQSSSEPPRNIACTSSSEICIPHKSTTTSFGASSMSHCRVRRPRWSKHKPHCPLVPPQQRCFQIQTRLFCR